MSRHARVGLFVIVGLFLAGLAVYLIGDSRRLWAKQVDYRVAFRDVAGLKPGAPVRTGGLDIGTVLSVGHSARVQDSKIYVVLAISKSEAARIRQDTVATVGNKGLLGDKMIELSVGSPGSPELDPARDEIKSEDPKDMFAAADALARQMQEVVKRIQPLADTLASPEFSNDIRAVAGSIKDILDGIAHKDGPAHRLLFDPKEADRVERIVGNAEQATADLDVLLSDLHDVTARVKTGPGTAHELVYDDQLASNAAASLDELHKSLQAVREGDGLARALVYGDSTTQKVMANVGAMSDDLHQIVASVKAGKGTLGALLVDPSIYEDVKSLVGNVERNEVLRALVRYSIKADESEKPKVETPRP